MTRHCTAAALCAVVASLSVEAAEVDTQLTTLAGVRPLVSSGSAVTTAQVIESLSLRARDIQTPIASDVRVLLNGWGAFGAGSQTKTAVSGDLDLAFIEAQLFKRHVKMRLGRQSVVGGVARMSWLDGVGLEIPGPAGVSAQLAFGAPVGPRFSKTLSGQWQLNTRVQWAPKPFRYSLGVSFIRLDDHGTAARQEVGLDGRWQVLGSLALAGAAMFNTVDARFSEVDLGPRYQPNDNVELAAGYRRTAPDLLIPRTSIFSVFSDTSRDEAFASVFYAPSRWLSFYVDGRGLFIEGEKGADVTVRATARPDRRSPTSLSLQGRVLKLPSNGYVSGRVSGTHQLQHAIFVSAELDGYWFDQAINGSRASVTAAGSAAYSFSPQWRLTCSVLGSTTPTFVSRVEAFARLVYITPGVRIR
jgi:hypothetical protein